MSRHLSQAGRVALVLLIAISPALASDQPAAAETPPSSPPLQEDRHGRDAHLELIRREAVRQGVPPDLADAVAQIESGYDPTARGAVGEVGLMQIRPQTATMLGYAGPSAGLFAPETNVHYAVMYLAGAWRQADGDLCRALMKYRAGHGEEHMTVLSQEYCRRARAHLAAIGSPLAGAGPLPTGETKIPAAWVRGANRRRQPALTLRGAEFWAAHEARIKVLTSRVIASQVRKASAAARRRTAALAGASQSR